MNSDQLLERAALLWQDLKKTDEQLQADDLSQLQYMRTLLTATATAVRTLKEWVIHHHFDSCEAEILFFKSVKPKFTGKLICLRRIIAVLCTMPVAGPDHRRRHLEKEFDTLLSFAEQHADFIQYYRRSAVFLDAVYFIRYRSDAENSELDSYHSFDERFVTSHDYLMACIVANEEYELFLKEELRNLEQRSGCQQMISEPFSWTGSKAALTELIFALHHSQALNGGSVGLSETVRWFEQHLNISLGNYHKTMAEINLRKSHRTKFLQQLTDSLHSYLDHLNT